MNDPQTESMATPAPAPPSEPAGSVEKPTTESAVAAKAAPAVGSVAESPAGKPKNERPVRPRRSRTASLYRSFRTGRALEGRVERLIKGGYEIKLGRAEGFCPLSQMDLERVSEPETFVGKTFLFRITQLRRAGENLVVSRRAILEEQRKDEAKAVRATLIEGTVMQGRVAGTADFGAFVDLGAGVMGLVHVSELSHGRVQRVDDVVKVGETVCAKILKVDEARGRISLSIRQAQVDPWEDAAARFRVREVYPGTVLRVADFGAFVELAPGVEALAPASEFPPSKSGWKEGLEPGRTRHWLVISVDAAQRRLSVAPLARVEDTAKPTPPEVGTTVRGTVQRVERFGVFVWLGPGYVGLMPNASSGATRGTDMQRQFPVGDEIEVDVLELADGARRIRLARKGVRVEAQAGARPAAAPAARRRQTRADAPRPKERAVASKVQTAFGSLLADKLKAALDQPRGS